jgi:hypothetical protein
MAKENENQCRFHLKSKKIDCGINPNALRRPVHFLSVGKSLPRAESLGPEGVQIRSAHGAC